MHIETTRSGNSRCHLLRQSYWQDGKPKKRTLCNLSALPEHAIEALKRALKRGPALNPDSADVELRASRAHGAVSASLGTLRDIGLDRVIFHRPDRRRALVIAMIVARLIRPGAKLRVERELGAAGTTTLAALLGVEGVSVDELYAAMDWLGARQGAIERKLARRHLGEDDLVLYDVSSSDMEGNACPMAKRGYSRDRRGRPPADRLRPPLHPRWLSGLDRGLRRQHRRPDDSGQPGAQGPRQLRHPAGGVGGGTAA